MVLTHHSSDLNLPVCKTSDDLLLSAGFRWDAKQQQYWRRSKSSNNVIMVIRIRRHRYVVSVLSADGQRLLSESNL